MKYLLAIIMVIAFSCNNDNKKDNQKDLPEQKTKEVSTQQADKFDKDQEAVLHIKEMFTKINEQSTNAEIVEKDLMEESAEGAHLKAFKEDGKIIKLEIQAFGETGRATKDYYFENEKLIFTFTKEEYYDRPMYVEGAKISKTVENRYYFNKEKLIKWVDAEKNEVDLSTAENTSDEILNEAKSYLKKIE